MVTVSSTVEKYREHIQSLLNERAKLVWDRRIQAQTIFDPIHDHYQLVYVGWRDSTRVYGVVLHVDIVDGKIWIQQDGTEVGIANELVELGVPKTDIVLGFDSPRMRSHSEFAVG
ncbi:XisI protein [Merismopedia glauca]|uniref:XisI protein n=1 Tax=Merismopedia glauca CCAP 1448/3 TaxID=1296344 RepID=A0A2T1BWM0_9CYAN|nr:XisI protein [Merismopedia glauca]PSB00382.1 XisI protein [Merismopedia glauca CCAP 1448/3]